jgi:hypothetical protein
LARTEGNVATDSPFMDSPLSSRSSQNDEVEFLIAPPFVDAVAFLPTAPIPFAPSLTPPPVPQRTRRRTQSQSHAIVDVSATTGTARPPSLRLHPHDSAARFVIPSSRSLWVTVALVTTVLMFGGVHPNSTFPRYAQDLQDRPGLSRSAYGESSTLKTGEMAGGARPVTPPLNPSNLAPPSLRGGQRSQFMYAVAARDAPLTFRMRSAAGDSAKGRKTVSDSFLLHGLYISMLVGIVLWSVREFRREVQSRRVGQESVCDLI